MVFGKWFYYKCNFKLSRIQLSCKKGFVLKSSNANWLTKNKFPFNFSHHFFMYSTWSFQIFVLLNRSYLIIYVYKTQENQMKKYLSDLLFSQHLQINLTRPHSLLHHLSKKKKKPLSRKPGFSTKNIYWRQKGQYFSEADYKVSCVVSDFLSCFFPLFEAYGKQQDTWLDKNVTPGGSF